MINGKLLMYVLPMANTQNSLILTIKFHINLIILIIIIIYAQELASWHMDSDGRLENLS